MSFYVIFLQADCNIMNTSVSVVLRSSWIS